MLHLIIKFFKNKLILCVFTCMSFSQLSYGQLLGQISVEPNSSTHTYIFDDGLIHSNFNWPITGGSELSTQVVGTSYQVTVLWGSAGTGKVEAKSGSTVLDTLNVTIGLTGPATPDMPTIINNCNSTRLTRGNPPSGEMWYWQDTSGGESTANSAQYVDRPNGTAMYYLKSYKISTLQWSAALTINYTVTQDACGLSNENYIHTITPREPTTDISTLTNNQKLESIAYFDGLGRPMQSVGIGAGGSSEDIITHIAYDSYGRQVKDYLPYALSNNNGVYQSNALSATNSFYDNSKYDTDFPGMTTSNINPHSEKEFEASPLNRVLKQAAPGDDWKLGNGHEIEFDYLSNSSTDVRRYEVTLSFANNTYTPTLVLDTALNNGDYNANELYKTITKDENHDGTSSKAHTTEEFKDKSGRVILKRTYGTSIVNGTSQTNVAHDTYYVYDDYGNLTYVLPPKSDPDDNIPTGAELNDLCYQYKYDTRNRLVEKKVPGKGWEYIVYNTLDLPILTQDQNLKADNKWLFTKYDTFGRVAYTGFVSHSGTRVDVQGEANGTSLQLQVSQSTSQNSKGVFYSNDTNVYPTTGITEVLTINYYDTYVDLPTGLNATVTTYKNHTTTSNAKGLPTVSKVKILNESGWLTSVSYYNKKGMQIYSYAQNYGSTDIVESYLDFTGNPIEVKTTHSKGGNPDIVTYDQFTYDHAGRLLAQKQEINGQTPELIVQNYYDELGILYKKDVGGTTTLNEIPGTLMPDPGLPLILAGYTDIVGLNYDATTGIITKTAGNGYNSGLATNGTIDGDGYLEYEMLQDNLYVTVGLAYTNPDTGYTSMNFALDYNAFGGAYVYELGISKSSLGGYITYVVGDVFKIERIGNNIHYKKNGATFYISSTTSTGNLLGDVAMYSNQCKIKNLIIDRSLPTPVGIYTDILGLDYDATTGIITKIIGNGYNGGLATSNTIAEDGYLEYEMLQDNLYVTVGLAYTNPDTGYTSIDYALDYNAYAGAYVYELGVSKSSQGGYITYVVGDVFKIERIGTTVNYLKNGSIFYTSTVSSTGNLLGDVALYSDQSKIKNLKLVDGSISILRRANNNLPDLNINNGLQTVNYNYNVRGWLTNINQDTFIDNDLFNFTLSYNNPTSSGTALFNGNISQTSWNTLNLDTSIKTYSYGYDALNRITSGIDDTGFYNLTSVSYDRNGNITDLAREGHIVQNPNINTPTDFGNMDNLNYIYNGGNQLLKVSDSANGTYGFKNGTNTGDDYVYDANGNMTKDFNKSIALILYNHLNLPIWLAGGLGADEGIMSYIYDANGNKLSKTVLNAQTSSTTTTVYAGNYVYENTGSGDVLKFFNHPEGYLEINPATKEFVYVYQYKDHLGNIRLSYKDTNGNGVITAASEILEENNYYPFGLKHKGYNNVVTSTNPAQNYKYNGKELNEELGLNWYDYGARRYDAALGRWASIDPFANKYVDISPYVYVANNPVIFIDPDGKKIIFGANVSKEFKQNFAKAVQYLNKNKAAGILAKLESSDVVFTLNETTKTSNFDPNDNSINWNSTQGLLTDELVTLSPTTILNHEADHALQEIENPDQKKIDKNTPDKDYTNKEEKRVITGSEQKTALALGEIEEGEVTRKDHKKGRLIEVKGPTSIEEVGVEPVIINVKKKNDNDDD